MLLLCRFHRAIKKCYYVTISRRNTGAFNVKPFLAHDSVVQFLNLLRDKNSLLLNNNSKLVELVNTKCKYENELDLLANMKEDNKEMLALIEAEKLNFNSLIQDVNENILIELLPKHYEHRDVIVEVNAGVGGKEAMLFANELFDMYCKYFAFKKWEWEIHNFETSESGGIRSGSAYVSGRNASICLEQESGVHRVQRVPATEKSGRIHTSTVTVAILPQPFDIEVNIKEKDLKIETKTSTGAGGQHVNKTESCVRITHLPTGIVIENQTDRSQIKNKKLALQRLRSRLYQMELDGFASKTRSSRKDQVGSSMRSEKIRTYNFNQDRVTDHRLGVSLHDLPHFLEGNAALDNLINQLIQHHQQEQLITLIEEKLQLLKSSSR